ncbi:hypothetical protein HG530_014596 [Fusarium avenaceum]|nr:hypothetical protein HG530_014596 [Fusarium avenaceum]
MPLVEPSGLVTPTKLLPVLQDQIGNVALHRGLGFGGGIAVGPLDLEINSEGLVVQETSRGVLTRCLRRGNGLSNSCILIVGGGACTIKPPCQKTHKTKRGQRAEGSLPEFLATAALDIFAIFEGDNRCVGVTLMQCDVAREV